MKRTTKTVLVAVSAVIAVAAGTGLAVAGGVGDDSEAAITDPALDRASAAALASTGGGRVTDTEVGDEESYYEVEVSLKGGGQVDVQLDKNFRVVGSSADEESRTDKD